MDILPVELQQEILSHLCGLPTVDIRETDQDELRACQRAPFMLAGISRLWRGLCLQTPDIWSFYSIGCVTNGCDIAYAELCLQRSAQAAVDAIISCDDPDDFKQHLQLLEQHQNRWRHVCFMVPRCGDVGKLMWITKRPMPRLRELRIVSQTGLGSDLRSINWSPDDTFNFFPDSQKLKLFDSRLFLFTPAVPMLGLRSLTYNLRGNFNANPLWRTLTLTPALEELTLIIWPYSGWLTEPLEAEIILPALRRLAIFGRSERANWTSHFKAPLMDTLTISIEWCNYANAFCRSSLIRQQVKHLILSSIEESDYGFLHLPDAVAIDEMEALEIFELRTLRPVTFKAHNQTFFEFLAGDIERYPAPAWASTFQRLVIRDCRFNFPGCGTMAKFVQRRFETARAEGGRPFELELVNAVFVVTDGEEPELPEGARAHFANYIKHIVTKSEEPQVDDPVVASGITSDAGPQTVVVGQEPL